MCQTYHFVSQRPNQLFHLSIVQVGINALQRYALVGLKSSFTKKVIEQLRPTPLSLLQCRYNVLIEKKKVSTIGLTNCHNQHGTVENQKHHIYK